MSVGAICIREVDLAEADESVQAAADRMCARNVGTLVVVDEHQRPVGMVTDRDLTIQVLARARDPYQTTVADVMSPYPRTVHEDTPIEAALAAMRSGPFRRLPVVDNDGKIVGLVSLDDILELLAEEFEHIGQLLRKEEPSVIALG